MTSGTPNPETVTTLANAFVDILCEWLTDAEMAEVQRRNATPEYGGGICASHDFCDANMAMDEAFTALVGHHVDGDSDADVNLWNAAWNLAHATRLRSA